MQVYLVGGAVRDELLNYPVRERDWVVVGADPGELLNQGYLPVGKDFPVFLHPQTKEEYALARTERKIGPGYKGFAVHAAPDVTLEEDLRRRDLTINAIAKTPDGDYIDPYGGRSDIEKRVLRHVSEAFVEDPVRVLRVARFAARYAHLGFGIAEETKALMRTIGDKGELNTLVAERVWTELAKALSEKNPQVFFESLREAKVLAFIFPEVEALFGVPQRQEYHPEIDTGIHTMMALQQAAQLSNSVSVRFAALVHDLGKAETPKHELPAHRGHEGRSEALIEKLCDRLKAPSDVKRLAMLVGRYHLHAHKISELKPSSVLKLLAALDAFRRPETVVEFLDACEADAKGRKGLEERPYDQRQLLLNAFDAAKSVDAGAIAAAADDKKNIADAIWQARVQAIRLARKDRE